MLSSIPRSPCYHKFVPSICKARATIPGEPIFSRNDDHDEKTAARASAVTARAVLIGGLRERDLGRGVALELGHGVGDEVRLRRLGIDRAFFRLARQIARAAIR